MLLPALTGLIYREKEAVAYLICAFIIALIGFLITARKPKNQ